MAATPSRARRPNNPPPVAETGPRPGDDGAYAERLSGEMIALSAADLSAADKAQILKLLLDYAGCALRGASLPWGSALRDWARPYRSDGPAAIWLEGGARFPAPEAAFVNASAAHGLEMDDTHDESVTHPGAVVISAALACAGDTETPGALIAAIAAGYETMARVGVATGAADMIERGFHPTGVFGTFGAATAAAKLKGLSPRQLRQAWGLGLSMTGGAMQFSQEPEGTTVKRLHAGLAARNGVQAAELAARGIAGPEAALDGVYGLCRLYGDTPDLDRLTGGGLNAIHDVSFKFYPCCRLFHSTLDALAAATEGLQSPADQIAKIDVACSPIFLHQHMLRRPTSAMAAQYALPFTLATALFHGPRNTDGFSDAAQRDPAILALADKVDAHVDAEYAAAFPKHFGSGVAVTLTDGAVRTARVMDSVGTPAAPPSLDDLAAKYDDLTRPLSAAPSSAQATETATRVIDEDAVSAITEMLAHAR